MECVLWVCERTLWTGDSEFLVDIRYLWLRPFGLIGYSVAHLYMWIDRSAYFFYSSELGAPDFLPDLMKSDS